MEDNPRVPSSLAGSGSPGRFRRRRSNHASTTSDSGPEASPLLFVAVDLAA